MAATYVVVWEFRARAGRETEFERLYGPAGAWARLFARGEGYLGTEFLVDAEEPGRYITIDRWVSRAAFEAFRRRWDAEYRALDKRCEALTERETRIGTLAQVELPADPGELDSEPE